MKVSESFPLRDILIIDTFCKLRTWGQIVIDHRITSDENVHNLSGSCLRKEAVLKREKRGTLVIRGRSINRSETCNSVG